MVTTDDISPGMNEQSLAPNVASPLENKYTEDEEQTREIRSLRNKVKILEERRGTWRFNCSSIMALKSSKMLSWSSRTG
ncbi:UNVERIFIED_CONTAM: hypothetical protein Sangu_2088600 [Sesamum angustifolium]|uniref:Uncharacterized protein n=1 Tax=Sesamum angustifolium TaxID=2727405 RepID=A0AAW2LJH2_9LAMI